VKTSTGIQRIENIKNAKNSKPHSINKQNKDTRRSCGKASFISFRSFPFYALLTRSNGRRWVIKFTSWPLGLLGRHSLETMLGATQTLWRTENLFPLPRIESRILSLLARSPSLYRWIVSNFTMGANTIYLYLGCFMSLSTFRLSIIEWQAK
jgi:hypothetical protein